MRAGLILLAFTSLGARHRTANFVVEAPTLEVAHAAAETAEACRDKLAEAWIGRKMPRWSAPCFIRVELTDDEPAGMTTYQFERGEVFGWEMSVRGRLEQILDSVLPHEVSHTVLASHFRMPLPRWADEGAAALAEDSAEKLRQNLLVRQILSQREPIPLRRLLGLRDYPQDRRKTLDLYAQSYSVCEFLVERRDRAQYIAFLEHAGDQGWEPALKTAYGYATIEEFEQQWKSWVQLQTASAAR